MQKRPCFADHDDCDKRQRRRRCKPSYSRRCPCERLCTDNFPSNLHYFLIPPQNSSTSSSRSSSVDDAGRNPGSELAQHTEGDNKEVPVTSKRRHEDLSDDEDSKQAKKLAKLAKHDKKHKKKKGKKEKKDKKMKHKKHKKRTH